MTVSTRERPGRNDPCHCGSGRKYKQCCLAKDEAELSAARAKAAATAAAEGEVSPESSEKEAAARAPKPPPKHQTQQPWKAASRTYIPRPRTPRKIGS